MEEREEDNLRITDDPSHKKAKAKLREACAFAKEQLSNEECTEAEVFVDKLFSNVDFSVDLTRAEFEQSCKKIWRRCMEPVKSALENA